jgi:hypothetical protein
MKKDKPFREAIMFSSYFNPDSDESLLDVNNRYGQPFKMATLYRHMTRHQRADIQVSEQMAKARGVESKVWQRKDKAIAQAVQNTIAIVDGDSDLPSFEQKLDAFIEAGNVLVSSGQMPISASNYIAAIKIKADIEMRTKDRKLEALKTMFAGAAPKEAE